jgi:hypothetical protein
MLIGDDRRPGKGRRAWSKAPLVLSGLGGVGLLTCSTCCALPLLGAIGIASGIAAISGVIEPISAALVAIGLAVGLIGFLRRRRACKTPPAERMR